MAEYIDRDIAIRTAIEMCVKVVGDCITQIDAVEIANAFEDITTADVAEVVRCKDCSFGKGEENLCGDIYCRLHDGHFDKEAYCSYGERK